MIFILIMTSLCGCASSSIRKECKNSSYQTCYEQMQSESQDAKGVWRHKADFRECWKYEYIRCCKEKGVNP